MIIGVIGSGGREHSICSFLKVSNKVSKIFCFPGNAGTAEIAENVDLDLKDFEKIKDFIFDNKVDLIVVGPEEPLVNGIVDYLEDYKIKVFGPNKIASQLEGSKILQKKYVKNLKSPLQIIIFFKLNMML